MSIAEIKFHKIIIDLQIHGSDEEVVVARVFFDSAFPEIQLTFKDLYAPVRQTLGSSFDASPLEVSNPCAYYGSFNVQAFQDEVNKYYKELISKLGSLVKFGDEAKNTYLQSVVLGAEKTVTFDVDLNVTLGW